MSAGGRTLSIGTPLAIAVCVCALAIAAAFAYGVHKLATTSERLLNGERTQSFASYTLGLRGKADLTLCSAKRVEVMKMSVPNRVSYSEVAIVMPVDYSYYVDMKGAWKLRAEKGTLYVEAPKLELATPAPDLPGTSVAIDRSYFDFGRAEKEIEGLKTQATARLKARGTSPEAMKEVREIARQELAAFILAWAATAKEGRVERVLVRFADEEKFPALGYANGAKAL